MEYYGILKSSNPLVLLVFFGQLYFFIISSSVTNFFLMLKTPRLEYYADILVHAIVGSCLRKNVRQMQMKFGRSQISVKIHVVEN